MFKSYRLLMVFLALSSAMAYAGGPRLRYPNQRVEFLGPRGYVAPGFVNPYYANPYYGVVPGAAFVNPPVVINPMVPMVPVGPRVFVGPAGQVGGFYRGPYPAYNPYFRR